MRKKIGIVLLSCVTALTMTACGMIGTDSSKETTEMLIEENTGGRSEEENVGSRSEEKERTEAVTETVTEAERSSGTDAVISGKLPTGKNALNNGIILANGNEFQMPNIDYNIVF